METTVLATVFCAHLRIDFPVDANTPADGSFTLLIIYTPRDKINEEYLKITFLPDMQIDYARTSQANLSAANDLLGPSIAALQAATQDPKVNFWSLTNWIFITYYWSTLNDLGQISPITYPPLREAATANFSLATFYPSTHNIFTNDTLYEIYCNYLFHTALPYLNYTGPTQFEPLSTNNSVVILPTTFIRAYNCAERQLKAPLNFVFSVFAVDFAVLSGLYSFVMCIVGVELRRRERGGRSWHERIQRVGICFCRMWKCAQSTIVSIFSFIATVCGALRGRDTAPSVAQVPSVTRTPSMTHEVGNCQ